MASCGTCRHWTPPSERDNYRMPVLADISGVGRTPDQRKAHKQAQQRQEEADKKLGICRGVPFYPTVDELPTPAAAVIDGSMYYAELYTAAEFFCALWADKDTDAAPAE